LLEKTAQGEPQVGGGLRGKARDDKTANRRCGAVALEGRGNVAQKLQPRVETRPEIETTLNIYTHAIPESQKRAVDKVAEILFPSVPKFSGSLERKDVN
jgi:hypothetical protein